MKKAAIAIALFGLTALVSAQGYYDGYGQGYNQQGYGNQNPPQQQQQGNYGNQPNNYGYGGRQGNYPQQQQQGYNQYSSQQGGYADQYPSQQQQPQGGAYGNQYSAQKGGNQPMNFGYQSPQGEDSAFGDFFGNYFQKRSGSPLDSLSSASALGGGLGGSGGSPVDNLGNLDALGMATQYLPFGKRQLGGFGLPSLNLGQDQSGNGLGAVGVDHSPLNVASPFPGIKGITSNGFFEDPTTDISSAFKQAKRQVPLDLGILGLQNSPINVASPLGKRSIGVDGLPVIQKNSPIRVMNDFPLSDESGFIDGLPVGSLGGFLKRKSPFAFGATGLDNSPVNILSNPKQFQQQQQQQQQQTEETSFYGYTGSFPPPVEGAVPNMFGVVSNAVPRVFANGAPVFGYSYRPIPNNAIPIRAHAANSGPLDFGGLTNSANLGKGVGGPASPVNFGMNEDGKSPLDLSGTRTFEKQPLGVDTPNYQPGDSASDPINLEQLFSKRSGLPTDGLTGGLPLDAITGLLGKRGLPTDGLTNGLPLPLDFLAGGIPFVGKRGLPTDGLTGGLPLGALPFSGLPLVGRRGLPTDGLTNGLPIPLPLDLLTGGIPFIGRRGLPTDGLTNGLPIPLPLDLLSGGLPFVGKRGLPTDGLTNGLPLPLDFLSGGIPFVGKRGLPTDGITNGLPINGLLGGLPIPGSASGFPVGMHATPSAQDQWASYYHYMRANTPSNA